MTHDWTRFPELNDVLAGFARDAYTVLGDRMIGAYIQGSFALGAGDEHSDCDFLIVLHDEPTTEQLGRLVLLHDALPQRAGHWTKHLEGSYPIAHELRDQASLGTEWWFVDHGSRAVQRSTHCNQNYVRWILRERGVTLAGPAPTELVDPVPPEAMREEMRKRIPSIVPDLLSWATLDIAWVQRYLVATTCRMVYTLKTAEVASKRQALEWAISEFGAEWDDLLRQVIADRARGLVFEEAPRSGAVERSLTFVQHAQQLAASW
jgi:hypothetical protein